MRFYTTETLSARRSRTPEGYLLCLDAPLARTGMMEYGPEDNVPIDAVDGVIKIHRQPEEVFSPATIASYAGKPLVNDHPDEDVTPATWRMLSGGVILNPRQGVGDQADLLIGDILITDPDMIELVEKNLKTELSAGYDADYEQTGPGEGVQKNIIINHVALVDSGRCGPRCRIGDHKPKESKSMATMTSIKALLHKAYKAKDAGELEKVEKEAEGSVVGGEGGSTEGSEHHVHVHLPGSAAVVKEGDNKDEELDPSTGSANMGEGDDLMADILEALCEKLGIEGPAMDAWRDSRDKKYKDKTGKDRRPKDASKTSKDEGESAEEKKAREEKEAKDKAMKDDETIEGALEMEAPPGTGDVARKAKDSAYLGDAFSTFLAQAEIIVPGSRAPTFDSAARPAVTYTKLCGARTETLDHAYRTNDKLREFMDSMNGGRTPDFKKMTCDSARMMIAAVATEAGRLNNGGGGAGKDVPGFGTYAAKHGAGGGLGVKGAIMTPADLNRLARDHYKRIDA